MQKNTDRRISNNEWVEQLYKKKSKNGYIKKQETSKNNIQSVSKNTNQKNDIESNNIKDVQYHQPKSDYRNYSTIVKSTLVPRDYTNTYNKHDKNDNYISTYKFINLPSRRKLVRNQIPKNRESSLDSWEYAYFKHIINLRHIFVEGIKKLKISTKIDTKYVDFFNNFSRFIKVYSSGEISPYLEELNEYEENMYFKYTIAKLD